MLRNVLFISTCFSILAWVLCNYEFSKDSKTRPFFNLNYTNYLHDFQKRKGELEMNKKFSSESFTVFEGDGERNVLFSSVTAAHRVQRNSWVATDAIFPTPTDPFFL